ncbi:hypothetical protein L2E82_17187 [Cichorium intybus]|uniref:Uncharacterized protein n=1 Tax=Cichorium intybus TaxID=13427 RepID=A0ACB9F871_CICIN|nr:hypothetical protein L2E82_17187 [Cichorium intybus]
MKLLEEKFLELEQQLQVPTTKTLQLDDQNRWNTTYEMLQSALENGTDSGRHHRKKQRFCLEILSKLESEISHAQEASSGLANLASKAESEAQSLKDALQRLKAETGDNLELYRRR